MMSRTHSKVVPMKKVSLFNSRKQSRESQSMQAHSAALNAAAIAQSIAASHGGSLDAIRSIIAHPRSLARPQPHWRPPSHSLPAVLGHDAITATITRHRIGPRVQARLQGFGEHRPAAYLITARMTSPSGMDIPPQVAEGWAMAIVGKEFKECVHEFESATTPTFVWVVDGSFRPLRSPAALFSGLRAAA